MSAKMPTFEIKILTINGKDSCFIKAFMYREVPRR